MHPLGPIGVPIDRAYPDEALVVFILQIITKFTKLTGLRNEKNAKNCRFSPKYEC
jgi:hypothetical protein